MGDQKEQQIRSLFTELAGYEKRGVDILLDGLPRKSHADRAGSYDAGRRRLYAGLCIK